MPQTAHTGIIAKIKINKWKILLFLLVFAVGIFLRSYHFRSWLDFESDQARDLSIMEKVVDKGGSLVCGPDAIVLGEIEPMAGYIAQKSYQQKEAYLLHTSRYTFFDPIKYIAQRDGVVLSLAIGRGMNNIPPGKPLFFFSENLFADPSFPIYGRKIESCQKFAKVTIYKLQN